MYAVILTMLVGDRRCRMKEWVKEDMREVRKKWEALCRNKCQGSKCLYGETGAKYNG